MIIDHPIIRELRKLQFQERSGCLLLERGDESVRFYIRQGLIDAASSSREGDRLGRMLLEEGLIRSSHLKKLLKKAARRKAPLGQMLLDADAVRISVLSHLLCRQAFALFQRVVDFDFSIRSFDEHALEFGYPCRIPLQALQLEMARMCGRSLHADGSAVANLLRAAREDLAHVPWSAQELAVLGCLRRPAAISSLIQSCPLDEEELRSILGTLELMGFIRLSRPQARHDEAPQGQCAPPLDWIVPEVNSEFASHRLEILNDQHSFISEQFKSLKISLNGISAESVPQVIGISSPFMGDGKSLVSSNLALAFARDSGRRVILVDCDLRKPTAQDYLGIVPGQGLVHYLEDDSLPPFCYLKRYRNLYVMTAGRVADNPVELLSLKRMRELLEYLRREFDTVVLDCPPFEPISDARILANMADGMLLVVRSGKTPYTCAERTLKSVDRDKILGLVLNDVRPIVFNTYYNYGYYYYGEKGGYPYSSKPRPKKH